MRERLDEEFEALWIREQRDGVVDGHSTSLVPVSEEDAGCTARSVHAEGDVHHHVKGLRVMRMEVHVTIRQNGGHKMEREDRFCRKSKLACHLQSFSISLLVKEF